MRKLDSMQLLAERARMFEKHLGGTSMIDEGKASFPSSPFPCSLSFVSRRSLMAANHYLSLSSRIETDAADSNGLGQLYLNRLGSWRVKGKDPRLHVLRGVMKADEAIRKQLTVTHIESLHIETGVDGITATVVLYGGGYSATMLPPVSVPIGISPEQVRRGVKLQEMLTRRLEAAG